MQATFDGLRAADDAIQTELVQRVVAAAPAAPGVSAAAEAAVEPAEAEAEASAPRKCPSPRQVQFAARWRCLRRPR